MEYKAKRTLQEDCNPRYGVSQYGCSLLATWWKIVKIWFLERNCSNYYYVRITISNLFLIDGQYNYLSIYFVFPATRMDWKRYHRYNNKRV